MFGNQTFGFRQGYQAYFDNEEINPYDKDDFTMMDQPQQPPAYGEWWSGWFAARTDFHLGELFKRCGIKLMKDTV